MYKIVNPLYNKTFQIQSDSRMLIKGGGHYLNNISYYRSGCHICMAYKSARSINDGFRVVLKCKK